MRRAGQLESRRLRLPRRLPGGCSAKGSVASGCSKAITTGGSHDDRASDPAEDARFGRRLVRRPLPDVERNPGPKAWGPSWGVAAQLFGREIGTWLLVLVWFGVPVVGASAPGMEPAPMRTSKVQTRCRR